MARVCDICGKKVIFGNNISHSHKKTRRVFRPNLQSIRIRIKGSTKKLKVCTKCLKSLSIT